MVGSRAPRPVAALLFAAAVAACTTRTVQPREVTAARVGGTDEAQDVVRLALSRDGAGDRSADTLYAGDAVVVANARVRLAAPRFAGITPGSAGRITITAANATVSGAMAWVLVDYRWVNAPERRSEVGRATVICERRESGWKIVHAHSSQPLPWEP